MSRRIAEQSSAFKISFLKKHGYLDPDYSYLSGTITWTHGFSDTQNSIGFSVHRDNWGTEDEDVYVILKYTYSDHWTNEKSDMELKVPLTTTPCHFGGKRYWFVCPLYKNGVYCGRRVGVLYFMGKYFGCRHCGDVAYQSQFASGISKTAGSICEPDVDKAYEEVKTKFYKGRPTRKYRRYLRLRDKMDNAWIMMAGLFVKKSK